MKTDKTVVFLISLASIVLILASIMYYLDLKDSRPTFDIGLYHEQRGLFGDVSAVESLTGQKVELHYYRSAPQMIQAASAGLLDAYTCSAFDMLRLSFPVKAISAVDAEYYLIGRKMGTTPRIGVSETIISNLLYSQLNHPVFKNAKADMYSYEDLSSYLREGIVDMAVIRSSKKHRSDKEALKDLNFDKNLGLHIFAKMSDSGYTKDMFVVDSKLLYKYDGLARAIFESSALPHELPPQKEIETIVNYLFKENYISNRPSYYDLIHTDE